MARLHPRLESASELLPQHRPIHLLTRHSVREESPNGFADYRLALTPEGVALARDWGARLPRPVSAFYSSPVGRCLDTARAMHVGGRRAGLAPEPLVLHEVMDLVEPGCYVQDIRKCGALFFELGAVGFINRHLVSPIEGVLSPEDGQGKLARYLYQRQPCEGMMAVHVTHDTILATFVAGLLGRTSVTDEEWPWMMEGVWLWFDDTHLHWVWRGEPGRTAVHHLALADLPPLRTAGA
ncbi:histidine phosphatase family protein [Alcanivorax quisquiliarum]|uniref:Histidine phosphatase family protein n=1 Tax=Alcanivorax quisquiliarum TaxID=2933565 RepID=A0ABT0EAG8_9GAMM|nr:histidine phosphatase family protein [Alcanivorax quisquiliarum]MCK0538852.1 histidine phosphatase family protein [Alcanivorax quisquiliarum]